MIDTFGTVKMGMDWTLLHTEGSNTEKDELTLLHTYQVDTGNLVNNPPLPSGAEPIDGFFYAFGTLSGISSDTYNFQSLSGNILNKTIIRDFDRIYSLCIQSTGHLIVQTTISGESTPFGNTDGTVALVKHNLPYISNNYDSGWDTSQIGDFIIKQETGENSFHYELGVLGSLS